MVYVRNQRLKASQVSPPAPIWWIWAGQRRAPGRVSGELLWLVDVAGQEAMVKVCGVAMAMPQGHSWAPNSSIGLE